MDKNKDLIIFDLDDTLAVSKSAMDGEMVILFSKLLSVKKAAIISGGYFPQFEKQVIASLSGKAKLLKNLFLFPTNGAAFYRFENGWKKVYEHALMPQEKQKIIQALNSVIEGNSDIPEKTYGEKIEDRGTQVSFSAYGQSAPYEVKKAWDIDQKKRLKMKKKLDVLIPEFEVRCGGTSTIDITRKGIDKAYGVQEMEKNLKIPISKMVFVGDALYEGGNDRAVVKTGIATVAVTGPEDTKKVIKEILGMRK